MDPELGCIIDDEYSVTRVSAKVAWYIPYMKWSRGGTSRKSVGWGQGWVLSWECGRGFYGCDFFKGVFLGNLFGIFLGQVNGCKLGSSNGFSLGVN